MIGMVEGDLVKKEPNLSLIMCGGVGYKVNIPTTTFENMGEVGQRVRLYTHLHVREDQMELFGFMSEEERDVFATLIGVSGVGPRLALTILSSISHTRLVDAVERRAVDILSTISGVGKKTAQRLVVELGGRLAHLAPVGPEEQPLRLVEEEAIKALIALGYYPAQARKAVLAVIKEDGRGLDTEELIKRALFRVSEAGVR
ncbi:MAG: Holliday junction branch migration protein RuvA [Candidatus Glassbacteria bacterium]